MHGFNKIIFYDNNSTQSFAEVEPWIETGFVSIVREWWKEVHFTVVDPDKFAIHNKPLDWLNHLAMIHCQETALKLGIDIFVALDIDEYLMPRYGQNVTVIDDLIAWMDKTEKNIAYLSKMNFSPTPHFHEPVNLLTIEAYQTRYPVIKKLTYYISTADKVALRLNHSTFTVNTTEAIIACCQFHGCGFGNNQISFMINNKNCSWYESEFKTIWPKVSPTTGKTLPWEEPPMIYHYARSLEKFAMKQSSYDDLAIGGDSLGNGQGKSIYNYLNRVYGFVYDDSALQWSCPLRYWLTIHTGEEYYLRPGINWYRNPEFGKDIVDPRKRGRWGMPLKRPLGWRELSPYPPGKIFHPSNTDKKPAGYKKRQRKEVLRGMVTEHDRIGGEGIMIQSP